MAKLGFLTRLPIWARALGTMSLILVAVLVGTMVLGAWGGGHGSGGGRGSGGDTGMTGNGGGHGSGDGTTTTTDQSGGEHGSGGGAGEMDHGG